MTRLLRTLLLAFSIAACARSSVSPGTSTADASATVSFPGRGSVLQVRIADDDQEREHGLMGVTSLPADWGMAFVFDQATAATFWMKGTIIPLSIAFVDADGTILTITEMTPCHEVDCRKYGADGPYALAIEANASWFATNGVSEGDRAILQR